MNHLPAILSLLVALGVGYLALTLESKVVHQQTAIDKLGRELEAERLKTEEVAKTVSFLDDKIFAIKEDQPKATVAPGGVTREQLDTALTEHMLMVDEKLKPLFSRPIELKVYDMSNPTAEVTPLVPPPAVPADETGGKKK